MAEPQRCPICGREMPAHAPQGLCPACLLEGVLDNQDESQSLEGEPKWTASGSLVSNPPPQTAHRLTSIARPPRSSPRIRFGRAIAPSPSISHAVTGRPTTIVPSSRAARIRYFGDYEIRGELGSGAMGVVYKARQVSLNRTVALKMIRAGALAREDATRRFHNEAEAVARLDHPNIVPIYEVGEYDGKRYFSMKLIGGTCLSRTLSSYSANPKNIAKLMVTIAEAIHHAHQRGVLHRDLKPSNILLDEQGQPHVSDFGLAKCVEGDGSLTESGAVLGTPAYMAPEQAAGSTRLVTTLSDVYGLGSVLYALLACKPPFGGATAIETLDQVRHQQPVPPSRHNPKVPRDLEIVCLKCLDMDPRVRYPSAQALGAELRRFLAGEPIQARRASAFEKGWRWCRRRPVIAGLTAALIVAVLVRFIGTGLGLLAALRARQNAFNREQDAREATELAEQRLYDVRMNLVQRFWENDYDELAQAGLDEQLAANKGGVDRRGFEWFYWRRKISPAYVLDGIGDVKVVAFSHDGERLASAGTEQKVKVWNIASGQQILTLKGHTRGVESVAFSPDGKRLASGSWDQTVKVWDAETGQETGTLEGHNQIVLSVMFSPDGKRLASRGVDQTAKVWDVEGGHEILTLKGKNQTVEFSPDGKRLASASSDGTVRVLIAGTGQVSVAKLIDVKSAIPEQDR